MNSIFVTNSTTEEEHQLKMGSLYKTDDTFLMLRNARNMENSFIKWKLNSQT